MWLNLLVAGGLGALAGVVGWAATRKAPPNAPWVRAVQIGLVVAGGVVGNQLVVPKVEQASMRRDLRVQGAAMLGSDAGGAIFADEMFPAVSDPAFVKRVQALVAGGGDGKEAGARNVGAQLAARGTARLSAGDVSEMIDLKNAMARRAPALCAAMWSGGVQAEQITQGLRSLSPEEQRRWFKLSARAMVLEVGSTQPPGHIPSERVTGALAAARTRMTPAERAAYDRTVASGPAVVPADACASFRALADHFKELTDREREDLVRMMQSPELLEPG